MQLAEHEIRRLIRRCVLCAIVNEHVEREFVKCA